MLMVHLKGRIVAVGADAADEADSDNEEQERAYIRTCLGAFCFFKYIVSPPSC